MPFWSRTPSAAAAAADAAAPAHDRAAGDPPATEDAPPKKPATREQLADAELAELLRALDSGHESATASKEDARRKEAEAEFESGFPSDMNCVTAFDAMYYCYSLGGQFMNLYRYGTLRDCSEKSADWRFCMKAKMYGPVARKAMFLARYKEKAAKYKTGKSSEDVWEVRTVPLREPFTGKIEAVTQMDDARRSVEIREVYPMKDETT